VGSSTASTSSVITGMSPPTTGPPAGPSRPGRLATVTHWPESPAELSTVKTQRVGRNNKSDCTRPCASATGHRSAPGRSAPTPRRPGGHHLPPGCTGRSGQSTTAERIVSLYPPHITRCAQNRDGSVSPKMIGTISARRDRDFWAQVGAPASIDPSRGRSLMATVTPITGRCLTLLLGGEDLVR
jgi:hypothetical protein